MRKWVARPFRGGGATMRIHKGPLAGSPTQVAGWPILSDWGREDANAIGAV